jgi:hypothetical protein
MTTIDGTLSAGGSGITVTGGFILGTGKLAGNVTVGGTGSAPTIFAGDSGKAGLLAITGGYTQLSTGTMNSFIGGTTVGTKYSQLQVGGTATLAGTLTVTQAFGFTPTIGSTFTVLTAGRVTGTFSNSTIAINPSEHFNVSYTATGVILTVASGAASHPTGALQSALAAPSPRKQQRIVTSRLRHWPGGTAKARSHFLIASMGTRARSGVIVAHEYGLPGTSNHSPLQVANAWAHRPSPVTPRVEPQFSRARMNQSLLQAHNWNGITRNVAPLHMPVTSAPMKRMPLRIMPPLLPRMGR